MTSAISFVSLNGARSNSMFPPGELDKTKVHASEMEETQDKIQSVKNVVPTKVEAKKTAERAREKLVDSKRTKSEVNVNDSTICTYHQVSIVAVLDVQ